MRQELLYIYSANKQNYKQKLAYSYSIYL